MTHPATAAPGGQAKAVPDAAAAAARAAALHGISLPPRAAADIAAAARNHASQVISKSSTATRDAWQDGNYRERMLSDLQLRLLDDVTRQGLLPVALPAEKLTYWTAPYSSAGEEVPETAAWETVKAELSVPVSKPPASVPAATPAMLPVTARL